MAFSKITLQFVEVPPLDYVLEFLEDSLGITFTETFKENREAPNQADLPYYDALTNEYSESIAHGCRSALEIDYNGSGLFTISKVLGPIGTGLGTVIVQANFTNAVFQGTSDDYVSVLVENVFEDPGTGVDPDFLFSPGTMVFSHNQNDPRPLQPITITGNGWKVVGKPNFILSSSTPGVTVASVTDGTGTYFVASGSGDAIIGVGLDVFYDSNTVFAPTDLAGTFGILKDDVAFGAINWTVNVYKLSDFLNNPFATGSLFFTKALDFLKFNSTTMGTYIYFDIEIKVFKINTYEPIVYNRNYKFPLFQGKGEFHIGTIVHDLLEEIKELADFVPNFKTNYHKTQYRPAEITISFEEKTFGATVPGLISYNLPMFKMAKGYKPFMTDGQLALLTVSQQEITRITPQSFIGTSFVYFGEPRIVVKKNNQVIEDFSIDPVDDLVIYSYYRFINDVKPGDSLEIIIVNGLETRSQRYLVFQNGMESTYFLFENDNGLIEPFEFSGRRRVITPIKHITTPKFKNLYGYEQKVSTQVNQTFTINTGLLTKNDHRIVTAICKSTNVWCAIDNPAGTYFKVDATTSKIANQDTSSSDESFDIEFNSLENADASIYPL